MSGRCVVIDGTFDQGRLAYVVDNEGRTFYNYDANGRLIAELRQDGFATPSCSNTWTDAKKELDVKFSGYWLSRVKQQFY